MQKHHSAQRSLAPLRYALCTDLHFDVSYQAVALFRPALSFNLFWMLCPMHCNLQCNLHIHEEGHPRSAAALFYFSFHVNAAQTLSSFVMCLSTVSDAFGWKLAHFHVLYGHVHFALCRPVIYLAVSIT
jgi:hypothetical protein